MFSVYDVISFACRIITGQALFSVAPFSSNIYWKLDRTGLSFVIGP